MKLYVAGPMRGLPGYNYPAFHATSERLRDLGYFVLCPAESFGGNPALNDVLDVADFARNDLHLLLQAEGIVLLDGWERSWGACTELSVAKWLALPTFQLLNGQLHNYEVSHPLSTWLGQTTFFPRPSSPNHDDIRKGGFSPEPPKGPPTVPAPPPPTTPRHARGAPNGVAT